MIPNTTPMMAMVDADRMANNGMYTLTLSPPFATVMAKTAAMLARPMAEPRFSVDTRSFASEEVQSSQALFRPIVIGTRPRRPTKAIGITSETNDPITLAA